jgi:hypothetical protein
MPESAGGFGSPPPSSGGFGAPAGGAPAGGGFGAPAAGGFGAPAGGAPSGGFGDSQPSGGFGGAPAAPEGEKPKSKLPLILGGCCLLILLISCGTGGYLWWKANQMVDEATGGDGLMGGMNRLAISGHLSSITSTCAYDPSGAAAAGSFHPNVFATYQSIVCQVPATAATVAQDGARSTITASDEGRAAPLGLDPATCSTLTCGTGKIIMCNGVIVHMENPAQFQ